MDRYDVVIPSKEEVKLLLKCALKPYMLSYKTMGEILGMKFLDDLLPKTESEPQWGYEGLKVFCEENNIQMSDTLLEALTKLK